MQTNEYITKAQAIELAESMRNLMAKGVADAFIKGIEGVEGQQVSWISVKGRLPEETMPPRDVLVYHDLKCGMFVDRAWYSHEKKRWRSVLGMNLKVTHWMPLPKPPKE